MGWLFKSNIRVHIQLIINWWWHLLHWCAALGSEQVEVGIYHSHRVEAYRAEGHWLAAPWALVYYPLIYDLLLIINHIPKILNIGFYRKCLLTIVAFCWVFEWFPIKGIISKSIGIQLQGALSLFLWLYHLQGSVALVILCWLLILLWGKVRELLDERSVALIDDASLDQGMVYFKHVWIL